MLEWLLSFDNLFVPALLLHFRQAALSNQEVPKKVPGRLRASSRGIPPHLQSLWHA